MIIERIDMIRDNILQYQPYFDKGFSDVKIIQYADRKGIFLESSLGEHEYALQLDYNFFYLRRLGAMRATQRDNLYSFEIPLRIVAVAKNVDLYKFMECLLSVLIKPCGGNSINNIETFNERILKNEGMKDEVLNAILLRIKYQQFISIDFSIFEDFQPKDLTRPNCKCDPCKPCAL